MLNATNLQSNWSFIDFVTITYKINLQADAHNRCVNFIINKNRWCDLSQFCIKHGRKQFTRLFQAIKIDYFILFD